MSKKTKTLVSEYKKVLKDSDINLQFTAPAEVAWAILSGRCDKQAMIDRCLKKRNDRIKY